MTENTNEDRIRLCGRVRYRTVADEGVLVHLAHGRVLVVSEVGLYVVKALGQRAMTVRELAEAVVSEFEVDQERAQLDVVAFLGQLRAERAIETVGAAGGGSTVE